MNQAIIKILTCLVFLVAAQTVHAAPTNTMKIVTDTQGALTSCALWHVSGVCFWLSCSPFGCSINTSIRYSHYNPDVVISTYHDGVTHPWADYGVSLAASMQSLAGSLIGAPMDAAGSRSRDDRTDRNAIYRDADAIGNPLQTLTGLLPTFCPTGIIPFFPYAHSYTDALVWRGFMPLESIFPASVIPGMREIGTFPLNTWGNVHPRDGWAVQQHPVKGSAVLAQRMGDFLTRPAAPHVYVPLPSGAPTMIGGDLVWVPPPLMEMQPQTGYWQSLAPIADNFCQPFGTNDTVGPLAWGDLRTEVVEGYAWNLWRPYSCCDRAGDSFLFYIGN